MKIDCLDYRQLPGQNPLFLSYLNDFPKVESFYPSLPVSLEQVQSRIPRVLQTPRFPREHLLPSLRKFNKDIGSGEATFREIDLLESEDSVAVVTGQQVGLMGGPCYAPFKAATAIDLAQQLKAAGHTAVPVFWLASDDSDFQEVRNTYFYGKQGELFDLRYSDERSKAEQMAGTVELESISQLLQALETRWGNSGFEKQTLDQLKDAYQPGRNFRQAFARWLTNLFSHYGLIVFDPLVPGHRKYLSDFFSRVIESREEIVHSLIARSQAIEEKGFSPQVWVDPSETLLFWIEGRNRFKLEYEEGYWRAKGRRNLRFSQEQLLEIVREDPSPLGANVLLRPILQDYLFPTVLYVGGPSEIAYFAQLNAITDLWDLETSILPRAAFTLVDHKTQRLLEKYELTVKEVMSGDSLDLAERILRTGYSARVLDKFDDLGSALSSQMDQLEAFLQEEDPTVAEMFQNARNKIFYQVNKVNRRFISNQKEQNQALQRHLDYLKNQLIPDGRLQERVVNFNQILAEEGLSFVDELVELINPFCFSHRLLYL